MILKYLALLATTLVLAGCGNGFATFPVTAKGQEALPENVQVILLDHTNAGSFNLPQNGHTTSRLPDNPSWDYKIGTGDTLSVIVFEHPELTLPAGESRSAAESGFRVQADGSINYPFIGRVQARGRAPEAVRGEIATRLAEFVPNPQIEVRVADFVSQSIVVSGEVNQPNRQVLTTSPLTLIEAINAAGGLKDSAEAGTVILQRNTKTYRIDLAGFLTGKVNRNNPILRDGDVVTVERKAVREAFLLGQVDKPQAIDLSEDPVSVTQAIARSGGLDEIRADTRGVFIFRGYTDKITVFQLSTQDPTGLLLGTKFMLSANDVVYTVRSPIARWNDTISNLLPTVTTVVRADQLGN